MSAVHLKLFDYPVHSSSPQLFYSTQIAKPKKLHSKKEEYLGLKTNSTQLFVLDKFWLFALEKVLFVLSLCNLSLRYSLF